jgi:flagellar FliL protein
MAKRPMANAAETLPSKSGPSLVVQLGLLVAMTVAAAGVGWFSGGHLNGGKAGQPEAAAQNHDPLARHAEGHGVVPVRDTVVPLAGMTTNLAAPSDVWLRLELAIVLDEPQDEELPELIHQDLLAYVRTLKLHQIEGASGFQHFKADIEERAAIRSGGHVKRVLIRTLLFE